MKVIGSRMMSRCIPTMDVVNSDIDLICRFDAFTALARSYKKTHYVTFIDDSHVALKPKNSSSVSGIIDIEIAHPGSSGEMILQLKASDDWRKEELDLIYLIKMSHRFKDSIHFEKTRNHIKMLEEEGAVIRDEWRHILEQREKETYTRPTISLNKSKEDFFSNDGVPYIYDHDALHRIVAGGTPAYTKFLMDGEDIMCDQKKFESLRRIIQFDAVLEESMVIALERGVIPFKKWEITDAESDQLITKALQKVCTSLCSGWFRQFAWDNYDEIIECSRGYNIYFMAHIAKLMGLGQLDWALNLSYTAVDENANT